MINVLKLVLGGLRRRRLGFPATIVAVYYLTKCRLLRVRIGSTFMFGWEDV